MNPNTEKTYWRSLNELAATPEFQEHLHREFPEGASELGITDISRRTFLGFLGASMALAGATLSGCIRKPVQKILPYSKRPEDIVPGKPLYFTTTGYFGGNIQGLLVKSHEGRPTKIEGNPDHPSSQGRSSTWAQASILDLYDPDRSRHVRQSGNAISWDNFDFQFKKIREVHQKNNGEGLALLIEHIPSPTFQRLLKEFQARYPKAKIYLDDEAYPRNVIAGTELLGGRQLIPRYNVAGARVILALDCDFLGIEGDVLEQALSFTFKRRESIEKGVMNRLYVVEPGFTPTGAMADNRLRLQSAQIFDFLVALSSALFKQGLDFPEDSEVILATLGRLSSQRTITPAVQSWAKAVAKDLIKNKNETLVISGNRQPPWIHALTHLLNRALNKTDSIIHYVKDTSTPHSTLEQLSSAIKRESVQTLVMIGTNPVYTSPADLNFATLLGKVPTSIHLSSYVDETTGHATWHIPRTHYLEAWGDFESPNGTPSLQQPLIAPLYPDARSDIEWMGYLAGSSKNAYELVKTTWSLPEKRWRWWLHDGVLSYNLSPWVTPHFDWEKLVPVLRAIPPKKDGLEVNFVLDSKVFDGRYANNAWLQELPDPMSKLTWDNAALVSPATAKQHHLKLGDVVQLKVNGQSAELPTLIQPGVADDTVIIPLGYGRTAGGHIARGVGVNVNALRSATAPFIATGASLQKTGRTVKLAVTQDHWSMEGRALVREATLTQYQKNPDFVQKAEVISADKIKSLYTEPNKRDGQQWGMAIDLNTCIGCNACIIACQAENNIPVVGKSQVLNGREMHWIRVDRYFTGDENNPEAVYQPVPCMQCENAPCETVCPVAATSHSPEGLNDMAYNRCIGTRYCANNCPYKVRRFNFFNYSKQNHEKAPLKKMQSNPDVTVRFRGVMEKCTYCVQRINAAKIEAHRQGKDRVDNGEIVPACAQACPTYAIVLGDINDPTSEVSELKAHPRNYTLLAELNNKPRTSYLAKLRNPNPELPS